MDYLRFMAQYRHADITGGPRAATVEPTSTDPVNERKYGIDIGCSARPDRLLEPSALELEQGPSRFGEGAFSSYRARRVDRPRPVLLVERDEGEQRPR